MSLWFHAVQSLLPHCLLFETMLTCHQDVSYPMHVNPTTLTPKPLSNHQQPQERPQPQPTPSSPPRPPSPPPPHPSPSPPSPPRSSSSSPHAPPRQSPC